MTIWEAMRTPLREVLLTVAMLLVLLQGYLCVSFLEIRRSGKLAASVFATFFVSVAVLFFMLDGVFHYMEPGYERTQMAVTRSFCSSPVAMVITLEVLLATHMVFAALLLRRFRKENLTHLAIKETMDLLPVGIAFAEEGNVVFANLTMNEISHAMSGRTFMNMNTIPEIRDTEEGCGEASERVVYPDGSRVWQTAQGVVADRGRTYRRLIATDITALAGINAALQEKHEKLQEINRRLDIYNRTAEGIITARELLTARMQVHNETGHVLLASRHFMDHPGSIDEAALLQTLQVTNAHLLKEYEADDTGKDPLTEAIAMASAIGVKVKLGGALPEGGKPRTILASAIGECATNTRKHADGEYLRVAAEETDGGYLFRLTSRGIPQGAAGQESGGLHSLRVLVEQEGGSMAVTAETEFLIEIRLPELSKNGSRG